MNVLGKIKLVYKHYGFSTFYGHGVIFKASFIGQNFGLKKVGYDKCSVINNLLDSLHI